MEGEEGVKGEKERRVHWESMRRGDGSNRVIIITPYLPAVNAAHTPSRPYLAPNSPHTSKA